MNFYLTHSMNFSVEFPDLQKSREITAVLQKVSKPRS